MLPFYRSVSAFSLLHTWLLGLPCHSHSASASCGVSRYQTGGSLTQPSLYFRQDGGRIFQLHVSVAPDITCAV
jgi:hypothetical protein